MGEDANTKLGEYLALVAAAGPLAERIRAGTYVSGRRWTLKLDGVDIRLPEADPGAALARLVALEREAACSRRTSSRWTCACPTAWWSA